MRQYLVRYRELLDDVTQAQGSYPHSQLVAHRLPVARLLITFYKFTGSQVATSSNYPLVSRITSLTPRHRVCPPFYLGLISLLLD